MNLDSYKNKWLDSEYHLYSLSQLVQWSCNSNNISQIVNQVTRTQFNSCTNKTEFSCIDHIYTNVKHKCSKPVIVSFGDSDHDLIGFTRLSKMPKETPRTIRKRSYKLFDKEIFLSYPFFLECQKKEKCARCRLSAKKRASVSAYQQRSLVNG